VFQDAACRVCRGSLLGREGNLVLKYFLLREAGRVQKSRRVRSLRRIEKPHPLAPHIADSGEHGYGDEVKNQEENHHVVGPHRKVDGQNRKALANRSGRG
jgi:hypothetical protein